jgi:hypothetical protein
VSKPPTQARDWGSASESLFREARTHHTPRAGDRERVRNALAQRIAQASNAPIAGADAPPQAASKSGLALSTLVTIGLGIVLVVAGVLAFLRAGDTPKPLDTLPHPQTGVEADHRPASAVAAQTEAAPSSRAAARPAGGEGRERKKPAARNGTAARTRTAPATKEQPALATSVAAASASPNRAPDSAGDDVSAKETSTKTEDGSASHALPATHEVDRSAARRDSDSPSRTAAEPEGEPAARAVASPKLEPSDPRAELLFVRRIQAAMLDAKPTEALALCAEHERRWPRGTFVQEREGLRAIAACQSDARDAGARANAFFASYPRGPLAPRVRAACASRLKAAGSRIPSSGATDSQQ